MFWVSLYKNNNSIFNFDSIFFLFKILTILAYALMAKAKYEDMDDRDQEKGDIVGDVVEPFKPSNFSDMVNLNPTKFSTPVRSFTMRSPLKMEPVFNIPDRPTSLKVNLISHTYDPAESYHGFSSDLFDDEVPVEKPTIFTEYIQRPILYDIQHIFSPFPHRPLGDHAPPRKRNRRKQLKFLLSQRNWRTFF